MILSKDVEIILNSANMKHYSSLGYENLKKGNKILVSVDHLTKGSHAIIKVKCDVCEKEKDLVYRYYFKSLKNDGFYVCPICCNSKIKNTKLKKYGNPNYCNSEKIKKTCLEKYGKENPSMVKQFKDKRKDTMLEKHGVEYYVLSKDFPEKSKETSMNNYGVPYPMMSDEIKKNMREYYIKMGYNITTEEFQMYKNKVYLLTKKVKNFLIESWDGKDYYDGEYIKDNFNLPYHDINYPTIDHKISIFEGFKNKMEAEEIANASNLCFTKRCINSRKYIKIESDFIS